MATHIALLGDSIFDNAGYTDGAPDVVTHLRGIVPAGTRTTLLAVDGSTTSSVFDHQVPRLATDVTHAAVSMGGNDALLGSDALDLRVDSTAEALTLFGHRAAEFEGKYRRALEPIVNQVPRVVISTIYRPMLPEPEGSLVAIGLALYNDVILRTGFEWHLPVIDLRFVVVDREDFANALEPSSEGGRKIALAISAALGVRDQVPASSVFTAGS